MLILAITTINTAIADTVVVNNGESIQDAINSSTSGDTILVNNGMYVENLFINKSLILQANSNNPADTIIVASGSPGSVIEGYTEDTGLINVTIDGFTIEGDEVAGNGTYFDDCYNITITNNVIINTTLKGIEINDSEIVYVTNNVITGMKFPSADENADGIDIENTMVAHILNNLVDGIKDNAIETKYVNVTFVQYNTVNDTGYEGFESDYCDNVSILNNSFTFIGDDAISVDYGDVVEISNNMIIDADYGIYAYHVEFADVINNTLTDIYCSGIDVYYGNTTKIRDNIITDIEEYGICTEDVDFVYVLNNDINTTYYEAVYLYGGNAAEISGNIITDIYNDDGIYVSGFEFVDVINNTLTDIYDSAIYIEDGNGTEIRDNTIIDVETYSAIYTYNVDFVYVLNNDINTTYDGVYLDEGNTAEVSGNIIADVYQYDGIYVSGFEFVDVTSNTLTDIYDNTIYVDSDYATNITGNTLINVSGVGIELDDTGSFEDMSITSISESTYATIENNNIGMADEGSVGIILDGATATVSENTVIGGDKGIHLDEAVNCGVYDNTIRNSVFGIFLGNENLLYPGSSSQMEIKKETKIKTQMEIQAELQWLLMTTTSNTISGNIVEGSDECGIYLVYAENNEIYNNYFNNDINVLFASELEYFNVNAEPNGIVMPASPNKWNITKTAGTNIVGGPYLGGNYWVHPNGTGFSVDTADSNKDGICDEQYNISETEFDYMPLAFVPAPAPVERKSSSGSRAYIGPSQPPEDVEATNSSVMRVTGGQRMEYDFGNGPVLGVSFDSKKDQGLVVGNVQILNAAPEEVGGSPEGKQYQIMSITLGPEGTISEETAENIIINFQVTWEWINENNIDLSTIRLMRFHDGEWQELPTTLISDDGEVIHFAAQTPGFSVFSIVGDEAGNEETVAAEEDTVVSGETEEASTESTPGFTMLFSTALLAIAAVVIRRRN